MKPFSFIIVTYNRAAEALALLKNIETLDRAQELLEEVIILNNGSTEDYKEVKSWIDSATDISFKYFDAPVNLGVAAGRNYALNKCSAPITIMLDDDAVLQNKDCLINLFNEFEKPDTGRPRAIVSFKVLYFDTLELQKNALPHKRFKQYKDLPFFETYYYAGGAHAIKKQVLQEMHFYPEEFFYGMEEYDLSYRLLDAGYSIVYSDKIIMLHKESPSGRKPKKEKLQLMWVNKSKVAWRYLPQKYYYTTAILWSLEYLRLTTFNFKGFFKGWKQICKIPATERRTPLKNETLRYLKKLKARLWY